jgi:hypothetical protein
MNNIETDHCSRSRLHACEFALHLFLDLRMRVEQASSTGAACRRGTDTCPSIGSFFTLCLQARERVAKMQHCLLRNAAAQLVRVQDVVDVRRSISRPACVYVRSSSRGCSGRSRCRCRRTVYVHKFVLLTNVCIFETTYVHHRFHFATNAFSVPVDMLMRTMRISHFSCAIPFTVHASVFVNSRSPPMLIL